MRRVDREEDEIWDETEGGGGVLDKGYGEVGWNRDEEARVMKRR